MGDPKRLRKTYDTPQHPWNKTAIDTGKVLRRDFGLRNRRDILKAQSFLKKYKNIAKRLIAQKTAQGEKEKQQILQKLQNLGLLQAGADLDSILSLEVQSVLNRRLQSIVYNNKLARSMKQARQFITHRHIVVGNKEITSPSHLVTLEEESQVTFKAKSALAAETHPERSNEAAEIRKEAEAIKLKKEAAVEEKPAEEVAAEPAKAEEATPTEEKAEEPVAETPAEPETTEQPAEEPQNA